jgi:hypothetical protein
VKRLKLYCRAKKSQSPLRRETQVSAAAVSRRADVPRTFRSSNPDARAAVADAIAQAGEQRTRILDAQYEWTEEAVQRITTASTTSASLASKHNSLTRDRHPATASRHGKLRHVHRLFPITPPPRS